MLRLLIDQDFDHDILRGLRLRVSELNAVTAREAGLDRKSDPEVLAWAAEQRRIVATHDRNTMTRFAYDRVREGRAMPVQRCRSRQRWEDYVRIAAAPRSPDKNAKICDIEVLKTLSR